MVFKSNNLLSHPPLFKAQNCHYMPFNIIFAFRTWKSFSPALASDYIFPSSPVWSKASGPLNNFRKTSRRTGILNCGSSYYIIIVKKSLSNNDVYINIKLSPQFFPWFSWKCIVCVCGDLRKTVTVVGGDWCFDKLSLSHLQSQVVTPAQVVDMSVTTNDIPAEKVFLSCRQSALIQVSSLLQALSWWESSKF